MTQNQKPKVLIVDDSKTVRMVLSKQLTSRNIFVDLADNGESGLEKIQKEHFDLIVTDINMPRMDGYTLCREIKKDPLIKSVPVIILSTNESDEDIEKGFEVGAAAYVTKNNASTELLPYIEDVLDKSMMLRDKLILVVDDSKYILSIVSSSLSEAGFQVVTAKNGIDGYKLAEELKPNLIFSDINMPGMSGIDFCSKAQSNSELSGIPFVIMSTGADKRTMRELLHHGASAFLVKPFNITQLVITAEKLLSDHFQLLLQQKLALNMERNLLLSSITSLIQALEARDAYTRGHSEGVAQLSIGIARIMGFNTEELERLEISARLHDLGKIGIRDDVLLKPGGLTAEEYDIIKKHPVFGAEILKPIPSLEDIIPGVLYHHEKMDGSGYPYGLSGNEIPLSAKIIAVADVYDALATNRPYRKAKSHQSAMEIVKSESCSHLCPDCVNAFIELMSLKQISLNHNEAYVTTK
jgi:response regulator RpfG family c-di-GMP phosphodiesterase